MGHRVILDTRNAGTQSIQLNGPVSFTAFSKEISLQLDSPIQTEGI
jgi:hypothetical protein